MTQNPSREVLQGLHEKYHKELYENVMPFWMKYSPDEENGGFFDCLDRDGKVYDTTKHMWLQGRQVWMLSKLHNTLYTDSDSSEYLTLAKSGAEFLRKNAREGKRVYFSLTKEGKPHFIQRKMFTECFYVMALAEYGRASGDQSASEEALEMFQYVMEYARDPTILGRPSYPHLPKTSALAIPMILLNLIEELHAEDKYAELSAWCVERIYKHFKPELKLVLETVGYDGELIDNPQGRMVNPGHAIECGWFLLNYARKTGEKELVDTALKMIDWSYDFGWDKENGGLYYFLDREGYSPVQLEWNMKLWWPHCEALIAYLMAWEETGEAQYFQRFQKLTDYSFQHFSDPEYGEWFGYLSEQGKVSQRFKGGPYKGCFHVPRALFMCEQMLKKYSQ